MNKGQVILVGAGPGDPDLLTAGAAKALAQAEVVVYDRLVSEEIMSLIPEKAEKINVGKNVGHHPVPQHEINQILLDKALAGKRVVRLKGGDPFVFGRGGEELELLEEHGIPFKVIPGITSSIAAAAYAGIPVTHRDYCSSLHIITGHRQKDGALSLDYAALARLGGTLVFMMSVASAGEIAAGLMAAGMPQDYPCAVVENGTRPEQRKLVSTLGNLEREIHEKGIQSPAVILVGRVCTLSDRFDWFSALPLKGKRILVTRPRSASSRLADGLRALGASVHCLPAIHTEALPFGMPMLDDYAWLVFTSAAGVDSFFAGLFSAGLDSRSLAYRKIAAVGPATAKALEARGLHADFVPATYSGEALARELLESGQLNPGDRMLLVRGRRASRELNEALKSAGILHDELTVYDTVEETGAQIDPTDYDLVTFTSASCAESFVHNLAPGARPEGVRAICIGEQTAARAKALGMQTFVSKQATIDSMLERIKEMY